MILIFLNRKALIYLLLILLIFTWLQRWPNNNWQVANCDVGQGDALVINLGSSQAAVFDTGPDPSLISKCLKSLGIKSVPFLLITHSHLDHAGGVSGVKKIGQMITSAHLGDQFKVGGFKVDILWPRSGISNSNNQSIVALISNNEFNVLVTGDIEPETQREIRNFVSHIDVYKVAHHGSRFQDSDFTNRLTPRYSIISVGAGNSYGHPARSTLQLLKNSKILRTDQLGSIALDLRQNRYSSSKVGVFGLPLFWRIS